ncbi:hypothetical protein C6495_13085 [Candidatus Poribacteria bacterium]|nr:MAG: hypothetical protein C6495_13085 [Candidatus Poribacteria bacterium]
MFIGDFIMAYTFHHVHLRCEDLGGAVQYYEKMFDGKVTETVEVRGLKIIRMDIGGERIFLSPKLGDMEIEATSGNPRWGVYQLAFTVEDLDAAVAELQAKGAELEELKPSGLMMAFFKGPDNVQIELIEA